MWPDKEALQLLSFFGIYEPAFHWKIPEFLLVEKKFKFAQMHLFSTAFLIKLWEYL